jgi:hypothetical protein
MKWTTKTILALVFLIGVPHIASAQLQLIPREDAAVSYIHHHLYVSNLDTQKNSGSIRSAERLLASF